MVEVLQGSEEDRVHIGLIGQGRFAGCTVEQVQRKMLSNDLVLRPATRDTNHGPGGSGGEMAHQCTSRYAQRSSYNPFATCHQRAPLARSRAGDREGSLGDAIPQTAPGP